MASMAPQNTDGAAGSKSKKYVRQCKMQQQRKIGGDSAIRHLVMGTKIELHFTLPHVATSISFCTHNKWQIAESPPNFRYCCILHCLTYFVLFKPAALSVFCGAIDAICTCTETSCVTTVSHVMYGNFLCYHSFSCYVRKLLVLPQFVWLCGQGTDGSTRITGVSNPRYGEYTIYDLSTHRSGSGYTHHIA